MISIRAWIFPGKDRERERERERERTRKRKREHSVNLNLYARGNIERHCVYRSLVSEFWSGVKNEGLRLLFTMKAAKIVKLISTRVLSGQ